MYAKEIISEENSNEKALIIIISVIVVLAAVIGIGIASGVLAVTPNTDGVNGVQTYTEEQK